MKAKYLIIVPMFWSAAVDAQTVINGGRTVKGPWDASGAVSTKPVKTGSSMPETCSRGELFFQTAATAGQNLYLCSATDVWARVSVDAGDLGGTLPASKLPATINSSTTGNAATATSLAVAPTTCPTGTYATGVNAQGNAEGCSAAAGSRVIAAGICTTCTNSGTIATVKTVTIPAGTLGPGDVVRVYGFFTHSGGTTGFFRVAVNFGGVAVQPSYANAAGDLFYGVFGFVGVTGASTEEAWAYMIRNGSATAGTAAIQTLSVNTANAINVDFQTGFSSASTEVAALRSYAIEVVKGQ